MSTRLRRAAVFAVFLPTYALAAELNDFANAGVERLSQYLQIDTINPPGNESRGVAFLAALFEQAGIDYETAESAPGRGNIWARLAVGDEPGLVLLHHRDVGPTHEKYWSFEHLSG